MQRLYACLENQSVELDLRYLNLSSLPELPPNLQHLQVDNNQLITLPRLADTLLLFSAANNRLTALPSQLPSSLIYLNLYENDLTELPELPCSIKTLNISSNKLTTLPQLPCSLVTLCAHYNRLCTLPTLPQSLIFLWANYNQLQTLPELPDSLFYLEVNCCNQLTTLPKLPSTLSYLDVSYNRLTELPELGHALSYLEANGNKLIILPQLPDSLQHLSVKQNQLIFLPKLPDGLLTLNVSYNKLRAIPAIPSFLSKFDITHNNLLDNNLPISLIYFDSYDCRPTRSLVQQVLPWFCGESQLSIVKIWTAFSKEDNAKAFMIFLNQLKNSINADDHSHFKEEVAAWLIRLSCSFALRKKIFYLAQKATTGFVDLVSVTWNDMQRVEWIHRIEHGEYDNNLPELVKIARELFRLEQLDAIAQHQTRSVLLMHKEIVNLAFQTKLHEPLGLRWVVPEMHAFNIVDISENELIQAEIIVKTNENQYFTSWLSQWIPWQQVLMRIEPEGWQTTINKIYQTVENIHARYYRNDPFVFIPWQKFTYQPVLDGIKQEILTCFTYDVFINRKLNHLIHCQWQKDNS